jgi:chemotaxis protein histidine kinase CheA
MNQNNRQDFSLKNKKRLEEKINGNYKLGQWLRLIHWNRFGYLTLTAFIFPVLLTFLSSAWLPVGQSVAYSALGKETNERLILAQEETQQPREENQDLQKQIEESATEEEVPPEESATEEEVPPEESATEEEVPPKESATEEEVPPEESATEEEVPPEESATEEEVPPEESATEEEAQSEEELSFEEARKSLQEEIDERYEEWESQKISSEISHSISGIATTLMMVFIILLGTGLVELPYKRLIIVILGIIIVLIQLNINIFILEKTLAGYEILAQQGLTLKSRVESVKTEEELKEVQEQFEELVLESLEIE